MKEIADRIREARLAKGMTQDELAKALGLKSLRCSARSRPPPDDLLSDFCGW